MTERPEILALVQAAAKARKAGRITEAAELLDRALAQAPDSAQVHNARGLAALDARAFDRARESFAQAARLDPNEPALHMNLATAARGAGDADGERQALDAALALDQRNFMAQLRSAQLHERTGAAKAAVRGWRTVVQLAPPADRLPPAIAEAIEHGRGLVEADMEGINARLEAEIDPASPAMRRAQACFDHAFGRRRIYANVCEGLHFPFLPAVEFFDRSRFPWLPALEAQTAAIRREAEALLMGDTADIRPYVRLDRGVPDNKWTPLDHSRDWSAAFLWEYGVRNEALCARCPATAAALSAVPQTEIAGKAPTAFFSILRPRAHIPAHTGVTNTRSIVHLPLIVPEGARFRVGGETRVWREGEAFVFDDTIEHEAWNDSDAVRVVLILDVWNPYLTREEQAAIRAFHAAADG
jgi:aspartate beta-hydroxylase